MTASKIPFIQTFKATTVKASHPHVFTVLMILEANIFFLTSGCCRVQSRN